MSRIGDPARSVARFSPREGGFAETTEAARPCVAGGYLHRPRGHNRHVPLAFLSTSGKGQEFKNYQSPCKIVVKPAGRRRGDHCDPGLQPNTQTQPVGHKSTTTEHATYAGSRPAT